MSSIFIPPHRQKLAPTATLSEILASERERILTGLLRAVIVLGFLTLMIITPAAIQENLWLLLIIYSTALGLTSLVTLNRQLSYEVRAPINAVLGYTEMLSDGVYGPLAEQQEKPVDEIIDSSHYLTRLVHDLLDQAHLETGKVNLTQEPLNLAEIVDKTQA